MPPTSASDQGDPPTQVTARGRIRSRNLQHYHLPVNADIHEIETRFVEVDDTIVNPLGVKAIANAVFHATGGRVRELPITPDKLLQARDRVETPARGRRTACPSPAGAPKGNK